MLNAYKKILDNVVSKEDSRPILKGVHYENGNVVATNSHQLVLFRDAIEDTSLNATIDLSTYLPIDEKYPDTERIIPADHATQLVFHNLTDLDGLVTYLKNAKKQVVIMEIVGSAITLKWQNNTSMAYTQVVDQDGANLEINFNAGYLYNAFAHLGRLHKENPLSYDGNVKVNFNGKYNPFTVEFGKMTYLICPVKL